MKFRPATEEDLKDFKFDVDKTCDVCYYIKKRETIGAYRGSDFYMCKECFLEGASFEEEEDV